MRRVDLIVGSAIKLIWSHGPAVRRLAFVALPPRLGQHKDPNVVDRYQSHIDESCAMILRDGTTQTVRDAMEGEMLGRIERVLGASTVRHTFLIT
jgi:hypothetical protein